MIRTGMYSVGVPKVSRERINFTAKPEQAPVSFGMSVGTMGRVASSTNLFSAASLKPLARNVTNVMNTLTNFFKTKLSRLGKLFGVIASAITGKPIKA